MIHFKQTLPEIRICLLYFLIDHGTTKRLLSFKIHWGRVTHICVNNLTIIGSDNGLPLGWRQAITWTWILLIGPLGTNFSEMLIEILPFSFKKIHLKMSSGKWRPFCLGLNVLINRDHLGAFEVPPWVTLQQIPVQYSAGWWENIDIPWHFEMWSKDYCYTGDCKKNIQ